MRNLIRFAAWLYPPHWRRRYGVEFDALLEDVRPGWRDFFNVLKGALAMQIRNFGVITAGCAVAGAFVAGLVSWRFPDKYVSWAMVNLWPAEAAKAVPALIINSTSRSSLVTILKKHRLYERELTEKPLEELIERMRLNIRIERVNDTAFRVAFQDEDPSKAQRVAGELISALISDGRAGINASAPAPLIHLEVRDPANLPTSPTSPNRVMIYGLGVAIGTLTGVVVAWFRRTPSPRTA